MPFPTRNRAVWYPAQCDSPLYRPPLLAARNLSHHTLCAQRTPYVYPPWVSASRARALDVRGCECAGPRCSYCVSRLAPSPRGPQPLANSARAHLHVYACPEREPAGRLRVPRNHCLALLAPSPEASSPKDEFPTCGRHTSAATRAPIFAACGTCSHWPAYPCSNGCCLRVLAASAEPAGCNRVLKAPLPAASPPGLAPAPPICRPSLPVPDCNPSLLYPLSPSCWALAAGAPRFCTACAQDCARAKPCHRRTPQCCAWPRVSQCLQVHVLLLRQHQRTAPINHAPLPLRRRVHAAGAVHVAAHARECPCEGPPRPCAPADALLSI